jgi:hypothetical protein
MKCTQIIEEFPFNQLQLSVPDELPQSGLTVSQPPE